jgi:S-adenosylmethionine hydrolase
LPQPPIVTLTTDFGLTDNFVGTVKGVILNLCPDAELIDISHAVDAFDILDGALTIASAYSYFPAGTVHLVVVDPGVGTARRPIIATANQHRFVAPDNGVLSLIYDREERVHVHHVTADHYFLQPISQTFHARDVFAPVAASLAKGVEADKLGSEIQDFVRLPLPQPHAMAQNAIRGQVLKVDRFGNLITNLTPQLLPALLQPVPPAFKITIAGREISALCSAYGQGAPGHLFAILGSMGYFEIAANQASAAQMLGAGKGAEINLEILSPSPAAG